MINIKPLRAKNALNGFFRKIWHELFTIQGNRFNTAIVNIFRLILYKQIENRWHYVRLTAREGSCLTESGKCGEKPSHSLSTDIPPETAPEQYLRERGTSWMQQGYGKPGQQQLHVMTLHFQMKRWQGYPAGAPWFDDWRGGYLDPIQQALEATCNGIPNGGERFSGNYLQYYVIFNTDLALDVVEQIAAAAPVQFLLDIHIGRREKQVQIPIDPNVPEYLRTLFRIVEKSARTIASELPTLFHGDPLRPEILPESSTQTRVMGEEAKRLRELLRTRWNFDSNFWDPLKPASPTEVVFLNGMADDRKQAIAAIIEKKIMQPLYLLDCEEGLFEITTKQLFTDAHEGMVFDASLDWVVYFSHHYTITFGGDWLVQAVKDLYRDEPDKLNNW